MEISRCKLTDVEKTICCENVKLQELQRQNAEHEKTIKDLTSEYQELEAKLLALKEKGPVKLAAANQSLETNKVELTDACTTAADWKAKCDNAEDEYRKLETTICEEKLEAKSVLNDLCRESDRLTAQLSETSNSLSVARCDSKQLLACVRTKTNQLDELKTEREVLKKRVNQYRLQQAVQQAKIDVETKMIEDQKTLNNQRLIAIKNEIEALKQASNQREEIIKIARNELNGDCLTNRSIQRFSM
jgi:chromosome segregation ATPase